MSGIVGIWNRDGKPVERGLLRRLSATLSHRGPDGEGIWISESAGIASQLFRVTPESKHEVQPLIGSNGEVLAWDGRLDNRAELLELLSGSHQISRESPDPELVMAAYTRFGAAFAERLNGDFALAVFDPNRRQLILARDALGIRPLYYTWSGETFLFASEIKALLAHPGVDFKPNRDMLAEMILQAPTWGNWEQTFFEGIYRLPRGHLGVVTPDGFTLRQYWDFDPHHQTRFNSADEYAEAFREHFTRAVQRRVRSSSPVGIAVSGGVDSSAIFCVADQLHKSDSRCNAPICGFHQTYKPGSEADEETYVRDIENLTDHSIDRVPQVNGFLNNVEAEVWHTESPLLNFGWNSSVRLLSEVQQRRCRTILTGDWADLVVFQGSYVADLVRQFRWWTACKHINEFHRWNSDISDKRYFHRESLEQILRYVLPTAFVSCLRAIRGATSKAICRERAPWYQESFYRRARYKSGRPAGLHRFHSVYAKDFYDRLTSRYYQFLLEFANKSAALSGIEIRFPFLDRDLLAFMMSIPGEMQCPGGVPKGILRRGLRNLVPSSILERRWKADFTSNTRDGLHSDFGTLRDMFSAKSLASEAGFINCRGAARGLDEVRARLQRSEPVDIWSPIYLAGLEQWIRVFGATEQINLRRKEQYIYA